MAKDRNTGSILLFGGLLAIGGYMITHLGKNIATSNFIQALRIRIDNVKIVSGKLLFDLYIENPTATQLIVRAIVGDVLINNNHVGNVMHYGTDVINPFAETKVNLVVKIKAINMISQIVQMLSGQVSKTVVRFQGNINADKATIPVQLNYVLN